MREPASTYGPCTLYLDQSDLSDLALSRRHEHADYRSRLRMLAASGAVRLRISIAHFIESPKLSFRRHRSLYRFLADLPHTVFARAMPGDIVNAEMAGRRVDLRDHPITALGLREWLRIAYTVGRAGPYADALAHADHQKKAFLRFFRARSPRPARLTRSEMTMPAHALRQTLSSAVERDLRRPTRRSDILDTIHLTYAAHSELSTVDSFVFEVTKKARQSLGERTRWFRSGSLGEVLDQIESRRRAARDRP